MGGWVKRRREKTAQPNWRAVEERKNVEKVILKPMVCL